MSKGDRDRTTDRDAYRENYERIFPPKDEPPKGVGFLFAEIPVLLADGIDPDTFLLVSTLNDGRLHVVAANNGSVHGEFLDGKEAETLRAFLRRKEPK